MTKTLSIILIAILVISCGKEFNSEVWKKHSNLDEIDNPRWDMVRSLGGKLNTERPTEIKIKEMLGEGEYEHMYLGIKSIYYPIGWQSGFGIDPDFFVVKIDATGQFKGWNQEQH